MPDQVHLTLMRDQFLEKPLPSSDESERIILGSILLDNAVMSRAIETLKAEDFYTPFNRKVFGAMVELFNSSQSIEPVLLSEQLKREGAIDAAGSVAAITNLTYGLPHFTEVERYITVVREKSVIRQLIRTCNSITSDALAEADPAAIVLDRAEQSIFQISDARTTDSLVPAREVADAVFEQIRENAERGNVGLTGVATGFVDLDNLMSGLQRTDLIIVAARPSMGKTALCLNIAQNAALNYGSVVAVFSLEMSREQLMMRMLSSEAKVNASRVRTGNLLKPEWERLANAMGKFTNAKLFIDDKAAISPIELRAKIRRLASQQKQLDLIVIDYLQLMQGSRGTESRQQEVSQISRELKAIAKEMNVPVIALSQLSRAPEARNPPRPLMSDLRESGSIEQDADVVAFIYREEYYKPSEENQGMAELMIAKNRNGPTKTLKLAFLKEFTRFDNFIDI